MPSVSISPAQNFKSDLFRREPSNRLREAIKVSGRSLQIGLDSTPRDDKSVAILQNALLNISENASDLPKKHLPAPRGTNAPPRLWGPYFFSEIELSEGTLQGTTFFAVKRFQEQAGLKGDGKAGPGTLRRLDEIEAHLEATSNKALRFP